MCSVPDGCFRNASTYSIAAPRARPIQQSGEAFFQGVSQPPCRMSPWPVSVHPRAPGDRATGKTAHRKCFTVLALTGLGNHAFQVVRFGTGDRHRVIGRRPPVLQNDQITPPPTTRHPTTCSRNRTEKRGLSNCRSPGYHPAEGAGPRPSSTFRRLAEPYQFDDVSQRIGADPSTTASNCSPASTRRFSFIKTIGDAEFRRLNSVSLGRLASCRNRRLAAVDPQHRLAPPVERRPGQIRRCNSKHPTRGDRPCILPAATWLRRWSR